MSIDVQMPSPRLCLLIVVIVALWSAPSQATTTVSGVGDPTAPLEIDPGSPLAGQESANLNFYTGDEAFTITRMPDTRTIDRVTLGQIGREEGCEETSIGLQIWEAADSALEPSRVVSQSLAYESVPRTPGRITWDVEPVTLKAGRSYRFWVQHGNSYCVIGTTITWDHNQPTVEGGNAHCSHMPFHYLNWSRVWHVQGFNDLPECTEEPVNFEAGLPTGWLAVQTSYPSLLVDYDAVLPPDEPDCGGYGKTPYYWKPDPQISGYEDYACIYTTFSDIFPLGGVEDGWYYASPWTEELGGGPRDMYLELHPVDYDRLIEDHVPLYAFDEDENFYPQKASAFTENWVEPEGGGYLLDDDYVNTLFDGEARPLAAAGSPETGELPPALHIEDLGEEYGWDSSASRATDYIDARGDDIETAETDSATMYELGHDDVVYTRVVHDPVDGKLWIQYWLFYYYNSFETIGIGKHEGDWEMVQIGFEEAGEPDAMTVAAHNGGYGCNWEDMETVEGTPIVYVAAKSHAEYPHAGSTDIVPLVSIDQHRGTGIVTSEPTEELPPDGSGWQEWKGRWGASIRGETTSPVNISQQGDKWDEPSKFHEDHLDPDKCEDTP